MDRLWRLAKNVIATTTASVLRAPDIIGDALFGEKKSPEDREREFKVMVMEETRKLNKPQTEEPLFTDKAAIKEAEAAQKQANEEAIKAAKERADLEKEIAGYMLKQLTQSEQRVAIEAELRDVVEEAKRIQQAGRFDPEADTNIDEQKRSALEMLKLLPKGKKGEQSYLARVGQWQGINYQNKSESEVVKAAKALLDPAKRTAEATETIAKQKPKTILSLIHI